MVVFTTNHKCREKDKTRGFQEKAVSFGPNKSWATQYSSHWLKLCAATDVHRGNVDMASLWVMYHLDTINAGNGARCKAVGRLPWRPSKGFHRSGCRTLPADGHRGVSLRGNAYIAFLLASSGSCKSWSVHDFSRRYPLPQTASCPPRTACPWSGPGILQPAVPQRAN